MLAFARSAAKSPGIVAARSVLRTPASRSLSVASNTREYARDKAQVTAVLGAQWGDEGKGKLSDVLAGSYDIVGRFNGGANAGHTVVADGHKFAFHLLPCGLVYPHTVNIIGNGVVCDMEAMFEELAPLDEAGISTEGRLLVSDRAQLLFGFHKTIDGVLEERRAGGAIGTTRKGIGPAYASKAMREGIRVGHLKHYDSFKRKVRSLCESYQEMYHFDYDIDEELERIDEWRERFLPMVIDGVQYVNQAHRDGKRILVEGANACMLDLDYGTYPYVTSSSTTSGGVATGFGLSPDKVDCRLGVAKAYTTRVGAGPFPTELTDERGGGARPSGAPETDIGLHLQNVGHEYGVTTGRKRRCGWLDTVVLNYSTIINGYSSLNLTKLDVMDDLEEVKIGVAYSIDGQRLPRGAMPSTLEDLARVEVEYETMPGWKTSIADCKTYADLPPEAAAYVSRIEELVECPIEWVGVGVGREDMAVRN